MKYTLSENLPLLDALALLSPQSSKTSLRSWVKEGRVSIDKKPVKITNIVVYQGQTITIGPRKKFIGDGIQVLYEDKDLVVIDKPSGLLSVAAAFDKEETAHTQLKSYYHPRKIYVVHRLDQDTSGILLFAFNERTHEKLKQLFEAHDIERGYKAIVEGRLSPAKGTWQSYLFEDDSYTVHTTDDPKKGRLAITHYQVEAQSKRYSQLSLRLETGRKNQIRVHCQQAGHSVVGDKKYGARSNPLKRLCLHAYLLAFRHPVTEKMLRFESASPLEFDRLVST